MLFFPPKSKNEHDYPRASGGTGIVITCVWGVSVCTSLSVSVCLQGDSRTRFSISAKLGTHGQRVEVINFGVDSISDVDPEWPFCRAILCISAAYTVMRCPCVCVCPSRSWIVSKRTPPPHNGNIECRWGRLKYRFSTNIWLCDP